MYNDTKIFNIKYTWWTFIFATVFFSHLGFLFFVPKTVTHLKGGLFQHERTYPGDGHFCLNDWNQITTFSNDFRSWPVGFPFKKEFCSQPSCWSKTTPPGFFGPKKVSLVLGGWESRNASLAVWSKWIRKVSSGQEGGQPFNPAEAVRSGRTQGKVAPRTAGWKGQDMWFAWPLFSNDDVQPPRKWHAFSQCHMGWWVFYRQWWGRVGPRMKRLKGP